MKIRKGDRVRVLSGKDRGKEGEVSAVFPDDGKVIVDGINISQKHQRSDGQTMQAGIIPVDMPMPVSRVAVLSPEDGKPTRVGYRFDADGTKVRICKRTGADL